MMIMLHRHGSAVCNVIMAVTVHTYAYAYTLNCMHIRILFTNTKIKKAYDKIIK